MSSETASALSAPPGLKLVRDFLSPGEERALIAAMEACGLRQPDYDPSGRSSRAFGWNYDIATDGFTPGDPIPPEFAELQRRAADFAGVAPGEFIQCLLNRYTPGSHIAFHFDKPKWEHIVGISLGAGVVMDFRRARGEDFDHAAVLLDPRSVYLLAGAARHEFQHAIAVIPETRWSITFRSARL